MNSNPEREAFERFCRNPGWGNERRYDVTLNETGHYRDAKTREAWTIWQARATQAPAVTNTDLIHHSALYAYLGYTDSFKAGDVVTQGYIDRLHDHYLPNLMAAIEYRKPQAPAGASWDDLAVAQAVMLHMAERLEHYGEKFDEAQYDAIATAAMAKKAGAVNEKLVEALIGVCDTPYSMVNDSESLRWSLRAINDTAGKALAYAEANGCGVKGGR